MDKKKNRNSRVIIVLGGNFELNLESKDFACPQQGNHRLFFSAFLQNCFLCWDSWNGDMMPTLDAALLCSSKTGSDLGCVFRLV